MPLLSAAVHVRSEDFDSFRACTTLHFPADGDRGEFVEVLLLGVSFMVRPTDYEQMALELERSACILRDNINHQP